MLSREKASKSQSPYFRCNIQNLPSYMRMSFSEAASRPETRYKTPKRPTPQGGPRLSVPLEASWDECRQLGSWLAGPGRADCSWVTHLMVASCLLFYVQALSQPFDMLWLNLEVLLEKKARFVRNESQIDLASQKNPSGFLLLVRGYCWVFEWSQHGQRRPGQKAQVYRLIPAASCVTWSVSLGQTDPWDQFFDGFWMKHFTLMDWCLWYPIPKKSWKDAVGQPKAYHKKLKTIRKKEEMFPQTLFSPIFWDFLIPYPISKVRTSATLLLSALCWLSSCSPRWKPHLRASAWAAAGSSHRRCPAWKKAPGQTTPTEG